MVEEGGFTIEQSGAQSTEMVQSKEADQHDGFSRALEMMQRNGTDEQTKRVYINILKVIKLNGRGTLSTKAMGLTERLGKDNPLSGLLSMWEKPRVEIPGMPLINVSDPNNPFFDLQPNYHNGHEWISTVCIDDPTINNENGVVEVYKPSGELNTVWSVQVSPGDEGNPGNMYSQTPGREKQLLTPALRQRIDDAFQACKEQSAKDAMMAAIGFPSLGYVAPDILSQFRYRDGSKVVSGRKEIIPKELYKLILGGEVIRRSEKKGFKKVVGKMKGFFSKK